MTAAYMRILIHAVDDSLFTDAHPDSTHWSDPPPGIVTTQSLLYASLATSLFAAYLATLGKQWISWYLRNRGGSVADKSRDRQRKLDGLEDWYFHIIIESLPVMLQFALLLLGCALSQYLWTVSRTVAGVAIATTLLGAVTYICFTIAATLFYNCPYQTPASLIIRHLTPRRHSQHLSCPIPVVRSPGSPLKELRQFLRCLRLRIRSAATRCLCRTVQVLPEVPDVPLAVVVLPDRIFEETLLDWISQADTRCVAWVLHTTTDNDMIFSTVRFAADHIWYPETPSTRSPQILTDLLFECLLDRRVVPGKAERASLIGMTLASALSVQLSVEPRSEDLNQLCQRIVHNIDLSPSSEEVFGLIVSVLDFVAQTPFPMRDGGSLGTRINARLNNLSLPATSKLWLGRMILQTVWRWRRFQHHMATIDFYWIASIYKSLMAEGNQVPTVPTVFKTIGILTLTTCLGVTIDIRDLYPPSDECVASTFYLLFHRSLMNN